jgi:hypothetical protein
MLACFSGLRPVITAQKGILLKLALMGRSPPSAVCLFLTPSQRLTMEHAPYPSHSKRDNEESDPSNLHHGRMGRG